MPPSPNAVLDIPNIVAPMLTAGPMGIIAALGWIMYYRVDQKLARKERENRALTDKFIALAVSNGQLVQQVNTAPRPKEAP